MTRMMFIVVALGLGSTAFGGVLSARGGGASVPGAYGPRSQTYQLDDGTGESAVGLSNGGTLAAINHFVVVGGDQVITSVDVAWGLRGSSSAWLPGTPFNVHVWANNGPGTDPTGANSTLLYTGAAVVDGAHVDNDSFQSVPVPSVVVGTASFYVGVSIAHGAGLYPYAVDSSAPSPQGVSWAAGGASFDPSNVAFGSGSAIDIAAEGLGNWMVRANAVPGPGVAGLFALAGLVATRRRR